MGARETGVGSSRLVLLGRRVQKQQVEESSFEFPKGVCNGQGFGVYLTPVAARDKTLKGQEISITNVNFFFP